MQGISSQRSTIKQLLLQVRILVFLLPVCGRKCLEKFIQGDFRFQCRILGCCNIRIFFLQVFFNNLVLKKNNFQLIFCSKVMLLILEQNTFTINCHFLAIETVPVLLQRLEFCLSNGTTWSCNVVCLSQPNCFSHGVILLKINYPHQLL